MITQACAELEIGLSRRDAGSYAVELRFSQKDSDTDVRVGGREDLVCTFDLERLRALQLQPEAYGQALGEALFAAPEVAATLARAEVVAAGLAAPLRLRLAIAADAPELHGLRWELLHTPGGVLVSASERILFSRYLASVDWQAVKLRPFATLRALVVVAAPAGLSEYPGLAAIDAAAELTRAREALAGIDVVALAGPGEATLTRIVDELRGGYDVLYIVAHGAWSKGEATLWLTDAAGAVDRVAGATLTARVAELPERPRLCVLASCESAGDGSGDDDGVLTAPGPGLARAGTGADDGVLAALGPGLARAGVAAVIAMQGRLTIKTSAMLMPRLFLELKIDGQVDRALAVARTAILKRPDWWLPVLFMRLRSGRIWYTPGFVGGEQCDLWDALLQSIQEEKCTPVLGPALGDALHGSSRELARRWADKFGYPMAPGGREDLPHVAQYLAVQKGERFPVGQLAPSLRDAVVSRFPQALTADAGKQSLDEVMARVADWRVERGLFDPYQVLARLPCALYVTTASDGLLAHHLRKHEKREPVVALCPWNPDVKSDPTAAESADVAHPLVYHLFGHVAKPDSLVITENDIFDFLISVTADRDVIPPRIRAALVNSSLLILGFPIEDWKFRVFFRSLMGAEGSRRRKRYTHVAAQIDPEEAQTIDPARTRKFLEKYFGDADITIYWGSADDFLRELAARLPNGGAPR